MTAPPAAALPPEPPNAILVALTLLHPMKGLLAAQQFRHHASDGGTVDGSDPDLR